MRSRTLAAPALTLLGLLAGCAHRDRRPPAHASARALDSPPTARITGRQAADVQVALGRSLEEEGKLAEAEGAYRKALANDAKRADVHARLAVLKDRKGEFDAAGTLFAEAIRRAPDDPEWHCDLGYHFYLQRRWAESEASLRRALALDAAHARSHENLALVLARKGDEAGALAELGRAGCDDSDARSNLGLIQAMEGRYPEAERSYAAALAARPTSEAGRSGLRAVVAARSGRRTATVAEAPRADPAVARTSAPAIR